MRFNQKKVKQEKMEDLEYGQNLIKSLGFRDTKDAIPRKEPKGSIMDSLFSKKVHKCHELNDKVVNSGVFEKTNTLVTKNKERNDKFESQYAQGGPMFERFRNASEFAKNKKEANLKNEMAEFYRNQMRVRQEFLNIEDIANNQYQKRHNEVKI